LACCLLAISIVFKKHCSASDSRFGTLDAKSNHKTLAQKDCHPEPFGLAQDKLREGSRSQILRFAQNDMIEWSRSEAYECHVVRFSFSERRGSLRARKTPAFFLPRRSSDRC
jgi:hypothetical protein